ncbi:MAG: F0F1 ATP synthase subunit B [Candidatus Falkowbacteria bacterium]|nr:F0F1 ATP synthase subunit B [Candidatus Falkowbacteria bacterium]
MDSIIEMFHIDLRLIIAQMINFAIVFFVLYKFAIKPLQDVMAERTSKIQKSLNDAKQIDEKLKQTKLDSEEIFKKARLEANQILENAKNESETRKNESVDKAKKEIAEIIEQEKQRMEIEKQKTITEIKNEVSSLVIGLTEKILEERIDLSKDKEVINKIITANQ